MQLTSEDHQIREVSAPQIGRRDTGFLKLKPRLDVPLRERV